MHWGQNRIILSLLSLIVAVYFIFGSYRLTNFITADEHYWVFERIPKYWRSIENHAWKSTLINDKPGVTLAIFSGAGLFFESHPERYAVANEDYTDYDPDGVSKVLFYFRLPVLIINGLLLIALFGLIRNLTKNGWIALWTVAFSAMSPILLGISQIVNPDTFLWSFGSLAIFSYLNLLERKKFKFLLLTSLFATLALLAKYTALILFPFFFVLFVFFALINKDRDYLKTQARNFLAIFSISALLTAALLPATWVDFMNFKKPLVLFQQLFGFTKNMQLAVAGLLVGAVFLAFFVPLLPDRITSKIKRIFGRFFLASWLKKLLLLSALAIFLVLIFGRSIYPASNWELFKIIPYDMKELDHINKMDLAQPISYAEKMILEFNPLVFSLTPAVLALLIFLWARFGIGSGYQSGRYHNLVIAVTLFLFIYYQSLISLDILSTARYSIILYPLIYFLAAIGTWEIANIVSKKIILKKVLLISTAVTFGLSIINLWLSTPYYFSYTNDLLSKDKLITHAWGYGGYEAAQFLNSLPQAQNLTIWADYHGTCEFFKGTCLTKYKFDKEKYKIDYYVFTKRGEELLNPTHSTWLKNNKVEAYRYYFKDNPAWKLYIGDRKLNYVKVFKAD